MKINFPSSYHLSFLKARAQDSGVVSKKPDRRNLISQLFWKPKKIAGEQKSLTWIISGRLITANVHASQLRGRGVPCLSAISWWRVIFFVTKQQENLESSHSPLLMRIHEWEMLPHRRRRICAGIISRCSSWERRKEKGNWWFKLITFRSMKRKYHVKKKASRGFQTSVNRLY